LVAVDLRQDQVQVIRGKADSEAFQPAAEDSCASQKFTVL